MSKITLSQAARIIRSEIVLLLFSVFSVTIFVIAIIAFINRDKTPENQIPWQNNIFPGITTKEQLISSIGDPIKTEDFGGNVTYFYPTKVQPRPNRVEVSDEKVSIIKEQITSKDEGVLSNYTNQFGSFDLELFGPHGTFAPGYLWANKGILIFGNLNDDTVVEIWYFAPTTSTEFLNNHPELSANIPSRF